MYNSIIEILYEQGILVDTDTIIRILGNIDHPQFQIVKRATWRAINSSGKYPLMCMRVLGTDIIENMTTLGRNIEC